MFKIDKKYGVMLELLSCPSCGQRYGHHNTKVDKTSEECSTCAKKAKYRNIDLVESDDFIQNILEFKPL